MKPLVLERSDCRGDVFSRLGLRVVDGTLGYIFRIYAMCSLVFFACVGYEHVLVTQPTITDEDRFSAVLFFTHQTGIGSQQQ